MKKALQLAIIIKSEINKHMQRSWYKEAGAKHTNGLLLMHSVRLHSHWIVGRDGIIIKGYEIHLLSQTAGRIASRTQTARGSTGEATAGWSGKAILRFQAAP
jgi:hypothetical protein